MNVLRTGCRLLLLVSLLWPTACAAPAPVEPQGPVRAVEAVPRNLVVELSVVRGPLASAATGLPDRNGRWVLFPDGALHYEERSDRGADWLPGKTRTLTRAQMAGLWAVLEASGFADPAAGEPPGNFALLEPPEEGLLYALAVSARDRRWAFVESFPPDGIPEAYADLARTFGALVWVADEPPRSARVLPRRYDFGPDPYAPFREP